MSYASFSASSSPTNFELLNFFKTANHAFIAKQEILRTGNASKSKLANINICFVKPLQIQSNMSNRYQSIFEREYTNLDSYRPTIFIPLQNMIFNIIKLRYFLLLSYFEFASIVLEGNYCKYF